VSQPYYKSLTGIRAIAAFMVYLHHYNPGKWLFNSELLKDIFHEFHVGVTIFFTLSGFLIATRYLNKTSYSFNDFLTYFINRLSRIYPLYLLLNIILFSMIFYEIGYSKFYLNAFILNLLLLKGISLEYMPTGLPQGWSLTVEECFYTFAIFFFTCLRGSKLRRLTTWISAILLVPATGFLLIALCKQLSLPLFDNIIFVASYSFFGRFTEFFIGIGLAILLKRIKTKHDFSLFTCLGLTLFCFGVYGLMFVKEFYHVNYGTSHPIGIIINNLYLPISIAILFIGLISERTMLSRLLSTNAFSILGKSSYAFYLIHISFIQAFLLSYFNLKSMEGALAMFLSLTTIAILLHYLIEEPANKKIRSFASRLNWLTPTSSSSTSASTKVGAR
jgi:peptidoglycan/LPS O-acetylase OafA/YrhL